MDIIWICLSILTGCLVVFLVVAWLSLRDQKPIEDEPLSPPQDLDESLRALRKNVSNLCSAADDLIRYHGFLGAEIDRLREERELESMRLAACGVAALGYFTTCAPEYRSASLDDVLSLRAEIEELRKNQAAMSTQKERFYGQSW